MKARWFLALFVLWATCFAGARPASAQPGNGCTISTTPISFGTYNVFNAAPTSSTGSVTYWCGWTWTVSVYLSKGTAGSNNPRQMASGANRINYNLYLDAAHTQIWGDPSPYSYTSPSWVWRSGATLTVYGLIPALQDVATGSYSDNVTATINF